MKMDYSNIITNVNTTFSNMIGSSSSSRRNHLVNNEIPVVIGTCAIVGVLLSQTFTDANPIGRCIRFWRQLSNQETSLTSSNSVKNSVNDYNQLHKENVDVRTKEYKSLVNQYYDLATVFYEWGWGNSFHFSYQYSFENFNESIRRHEYQLASHLTSCLYNNNNNTNDKSKILDVGCGIGGPMRNISKFLQTNITGVTLNHYQVQRGNELNKKDINSNCISVQGDFMNLEQFKDGEFDGAYAIEATCHAPNRVECYKEILRCIKPGGIFAVYEWCMTNKYDPNNPEHIRFKKEIEEGNGLPDIINCDECLIAMKDAGFDILTVSDQATIPNVQKWETPLTASWNPLSQRFQFNWLGGHITNIVIALMEFIWLAPKGTVKTQQLLQTGGFALRDAGKEGIFTTMYLMVGRKPLTT